MMYRTFVFLLLAGPALLGQNRQNKPLPVFSETPYAVLQDSIKGWSYSLDGQWLSGDRTIPVRGVSRNEEFYNNDENSLGLDNFTKILAYKVKYGRDTMVCIVKLFTEGRYRYPTRKRGWKEYLNAYYMVVDYSDLKQIKNLEQETVHVQKIRAYDGGLISDIKEKEVLEQIKEQVVIKPAYNRNLVLTVQLLRSDEKARFQLCSLHDIFPDVEGVAQDFTRKGRTVYGSTRLFDFLYYEARYYDLLSLAEMPAEDELISDEY